jgi:hypothetical protein
MRIWIESRAASWSRITSDGTPGVPRHFLTTFTFQIRPIGEFACRFLHHTFELWPVMRGIG